MYQVLARKYRPKNFHELLGQSHVSTALINGIEQHRLHHAYLFTGTRGVGKTTIARILAKCLNCETGVTSEPCGVCSTCVAIDVGRFIDLIEIDAASRTKVEDTRELLDNVPYAPTQGRYKVYLIDEVHMLSTHSFNALLKTLEEPPEHVKFLLATTDPQKLPITIISRCLQFVLRPIPQSQLADYLAVILQKEQITFSADALWQLASSARGSVRDALSLTDQAIAFGNGQIEPATVKSMLGLIDQADVVGLLAAIVQQQKSQVAQYIQQLREQVVDAKAVFDSLSEVLHQVALLQVLPEFDLQLNSEQTQARQMLSHLIPSDLLQLYYEIVVQSRENIGLANTPLQALEMCILRLLAFRPLAMNEMAVQVQDSVPALDNSLSANPPTILPQSALLENSQATIAPLKTALETALEKKTPETSLENPPAQSPVANNENDLQTALQDIGENGFDNIATNNAVLDNQSSYETQLHEENFSDQQIILAEQNFPQPQAITEVEVSNTYQNLTNPFVEQDNFTQPLGDNEHFSQHPVSASQNTPAESVTNGVLLENNDAGILNQPVSIQDSHSPYSYDNQADDISPLALLEPAPQAMTGEWTPQKWDYWVYEARKQGWLAEDELVLAKRGVMVGEIGGKSQFLTHKNILTDSRTFEDLCQKLAEHFPNSQVTLDTPTAQVAMNLNLTTDIPEHHQIVRDQQALAIATQKIQQLPVMQALLAQNASLQQVELKK